MARSKKDTSAIVSALGVLMSIITALVSAVRKQGGTDADIYRLATPEGESLLEKIAALIVQAGKPVQEAVAETVKTVVELLKRVATTSVDGAEKFVVKDHIKAANVGWTGTNFQRLFLNKVEENVIATTLAVDSLLRNSLDAPILTELGRRAETKLAYMFELLKKQAHGEPGILLTNGCANIFYILDDENNLWAVDAYWGSGNRYWRVESVSVGYQFGWYGSNQVFSQAA